MSTVEFTSDVVRSTKFREKMRGYHPEEVDAFLQRTATALEVLQGRLAEVTERAMKAEAALESNSETDESIRRTLTLAQRTAEMAINEARDEADRLREEAAAEVARQRDESDTECRRLVEEAETRAESLRSEAEKVRDEAQAEASAKVAEAERLADELHHDCEERIATAERESRERIDAAQAEADARLAAQAEEARRDLEASVASLTAQRSELRAHVEALAAYLAEERARVLEALSGALEGFGITLAPTSRPAMVESAMTATDPVVAVFEATATESHGSPEWTAINDFGGGPAAATEMEAASEPEASDAVRSEREADVEPGTDPGLDGDYAAEFGGPAAAWFPESVAPEAEAADPWAAPSEEQVAEESEAEPPSRLLFTIEDELRHADESVEDRVDTKPRKTLLGRRRG